MSVPASPLSIFAPAVTAPAIVPQYLVAFNNAPTDDPALITTVASPPGTLGGANVWTDISRWVSSDDHQRGRQQELQQFEAGTATLKLRNDDGRFTPWNTISPYAGLVIPKKLVQIRCTFQGVTYTRWTGQVAGWQMEWPDASQQLVTLTVADAFRFLNMADITSTGYAAKVLADGASGYWRLGDPVGSAVVSDSGPNGYTGNAIVPGTQGPTTVSFGNAGLMVADPTTSMTIGTTSGPISGYVTFPGSGIATGSSFTFNVWVKYVGSNSGTNTFINISDGTNNAFMVFNPSLGVKNNNGALAAVASGYLTTITSGNPTMVTAVFTAGVGWALYVNGATATLSGGGPAGVGNPTFTNIEDAGEFDWQDFSVFPSALSGAQVAALYTLATLPAQTADVRFGRVLDIVNWSAGARSLDSNCSGSASGYGGSVPPGGIQAVTSSLVNTSCLAHIQQVEATEGGACFMTTDGKVRLISRQTLFSNATYTTSQATFGDNTAAGDIPFIPGGAPTRDDLFTYNEAVAARTGGNTQRSIDQTSINTNGRTTWQPPSTLIGNSDIEVLGQTQYVVTKFKTPVDRLKSITVDLYSLANSLPSVVPTLLSLDLLSRVTVERTIMPGGGTAFSQVANIEHIQETITPTQWLITFALAVADPGWWVLGTSQLGTTTRLAF